MASVAAITDVGEEVSNIRTLPVLQIPGKPPYCQIQNCKADPVIYWFAGQVWMCGVHCLEIVPCGEA